MEDETRNQLGDSENANSGSEDNANAVLGTNSPEENFRLFIGPNPDKFIQAAGVGVGGKQSWSWNWAAFFTGPVWFFYRKLYLTGACLLLIPVMLVVIFPKLANFNIGFGGLMGMGANSLYVWHASRMISKIKKLGLSPEEFKDRLRKTGGTSPAGAVFGVLIILPLLVFPFLEYASTSLPLCNDAQVQEMAGDLTSQALRNSGVSIEGLQVFDFKPIEKQNDPSRQLCSYRVEFASEKETLYLAVTWADQEKGQFQIQINSSLESLSE